MMQNYEDILAAIKLASKGPFGRRTLAAMVRQCLPLVLTLREDGASWEQLAALFAASGRDAGAEVIRKTVRRAEQNGTSEYGSTRARQPLAAQFRNPAPYLHWTPTPTVKVAATPQSTGPPLPPHLSPDQQGGGSKSLALARRTLEQRNKLKSIK